MKLSNIQNITGVVTVQVEGFFTERFINLCKINNIKIWDIRNIVNGVVRFKIKISDFKKLRKVVKKTKCKVSIKKKEGLYFTLFKYRKRKIIFFLVFLAIFFMVAFSTFIWNINVVGNETIATEEILQQLKNSGLYIGKSKLNFDKKEVVNNLRMNVADISWVGIEVDGTLATVKIVEKTKLDDKDVQNKEVGDIVANKNGLLTRVVPEKGTALFNENSYVEKGTVIIEGKMYSKFIDNYMVAAKGIVRADCSYKYSNEYKYSTIKKEYTDKKIYTIGISINSKENMLNYLNKSKKYDISKSSKFLNIFGLNLSFDLYTCVEYVENNIIKTKDELINKSKEDIENYLNNEILTNTINGVLKDKNTVYNETNEGFVIETEYIVNEEIGEFVKSDYEQTNEKYTY